MIVRTATHIKPEKTPTKMKMVIMMLMTELSKPHIVITHFVDFGTKRPHKSSDELGRLSLRPPNPRSPRHRWEK